MPDRRKPRSLSKLPTNRIVSVEYPKKPGTPIGEAELRALLDDDPGFLFECCRDLIDEIPNAPLSRIGEGDHRGRYALSLKPETLPKELRINDFQDINKVMEQGWKQCHDTRSPLPDMTMQPITEELKVIGFRLIFRQINTFNAAMDAHTRLKGQADHLKESLAEVQSRNDFHPRLYHDTQYRHRH